MMVGYFRLYMMRCGSRLSMIVGDELMMVGDDVMICMRC
jgi:hypothetical protein